MTAPLPRSSRDNNFDFLRFVGALLVFISHATFVPSGTLQADPLYRLSGGQMTLGWIGVAMFFVISGYLVTQSWERRSSLARFLTARALRLYPALVIVTLAIYLTGGVITSTSEYWGNPDALEYFGNILVPFSDNHLPGVFQELPARSVSDNFWTLRYEIGVYALLALMGALAVWRRDTVLVLFLLVSFLFILGGVHTNNGWFDLPRYFLAGSLLYLYRQRYSWTSLFAWLSAAALVFAAYTGGLKVAFSVFGAYLTLYLAFTPRLKLANFGRYGDFSYGLYLSGFFVQQLVQRSNPGFSSTANFLVAFPIAFTIAVILWYAVEKPALTLKQHRGARDVQRPGTARAVHAPQHDHHDQ